MGNQNGAEMAERFWELEKEVDGWAELPKIKAARYELIMPWLP